MRLTGPVNGMAPQHQQPLKAWGSTSGGGIPSLDSPSWGTASITDVDVGVLDITFVAELGSPFYAMNVQCRTVTTNLLIARVSTLPTPTTTTIRIVAGGLDGTFTDPTLGYTWMVQGE